MRLLDAATTELADSSRSAGINCGATWVVAEILGQPKRLDPELAIYISIFMTFRSDPCIRFRML